MAKRCANEKLTVSVLLSILYKESELWQGQTRELSGHDGLPLWWRGHSWVPQRQEMRQPSLLLWQFNLRIHQSYSARISLCGQSALPVCQWSGRQEKGMSKDGWRSHLKPPTLLPHMDQLMLPVLANSSVGSSRLTHMHTSSVLSKQTPP